MKLPVVRYSPVGAVLDTWKKKGKCKISIQYLRNMKHRHFSEHVKLGNLLSAQYR